MSASKCIYRELDWGEELGLDEYECELAPQCSYQLEKAQEDQFLDEETLGCCAERVKDKIYYRWLQENCPNPEKKNIITNVKRTILEI